MALQGFNFAPMKVFLNDVYFIPNYQREYAWDTEEIEDFWKDVEYTHEHPDITHFYGQIVVHNDEETRKKYIIDGQQRTITSMIFLRALQLVYDKLFADYTLKAANKKSVTISSGFIGDYDETEKKLHLTIGRNDNEYYIQHIICGEPSAKNVKKKSRDRMRKAFKYLYENLHSIVYAPEEPNEKLAVANEYFETFADNFKVMYIEATKLEEAFIIFETLNARGKDLETADLLKNYIFSKASDISMTEQKWNSMIKQLDNIDPTKYIRHFWNSSNAFVRDKELYHRITNNINTVRRAKEFINRLEKYAQAYHDMVVPEDNVDFDNAKLVNSLKAINTMKAKTFYPVMLAMLQSDVGFKEADLAKVSDTIESYIFRNFTICGKVANRMEIMMAEIAYDIYEGNLADSKTICTAIREGYNGKEGMVSDEEFAQQFQKWATKNKDIIRYVLRRIHSYLDKNNEININNTEVHIEHIMPVNNSKWKVDEQIHEEYLWRLGNLALLSEKLNVAISNDVFDKKKDKYKKSKIEPNQEIAKEKVWGKAQIEKRQQMLTEVALKIWK